MTLGFIYFFLMGIFLTYSIWCFFFYFYIRYKYNKYVDEEEAPVGKIQFLYERYHLNKLYWWLYQKNKKMWIFREKVYDFGLMIKSIVFLILGSALLIGYLYLNNTEFIEYFKLKV